MTIGRVQPGTRTQFWVKKKKRETRIKRKNEKKKKGNYIRIFVFDKFSLFHPRITGDGFLTRV